MYTRVPLIIRYYLAGTLCMGDSIGGFSVVKSYHTSYVEFEFIILFFFCFFFCCVLRTLVGTRTHNAC